ncbi:putative hydroxypyruvate isomerase isoform X1 [Chelonoidis abingdonii]|uniref:putative hydroxypyruvate isomerase isoform X1 n=1 Tax=Chelonoidis abingdonii TaxID=106734 RepID=UPI0013F29096|nr:putative hydroxypyruvate isomerase [Chelonoidis abingdonii]
MESQRLGGCSLQPPGYGQMWALTDQVQGCGASPFHMGAGILVPGWLAGQGSGLLLPLTRAVLAALSLGDEDKGEKGLGAVPGRQAAFREGLALAVKYAKTLGCPRIHLMAGRVPVGTERAAMALEMEATFIENLRYAADILAQEDMTGLLEPMNSRITDPRYFLTTPHQAAAILEKVGRPNLRLQLDIFHCQIMDGNLTRNLEMYFPLIGHIQVGQVPGRHEPNSPGEVNFPYLFQLLESLGYEGYVGCEYTPQGNTLEGLGWLHAYWESRSQQQRRY